MIVTLLPVIIALAIISGIFIGRFLYLIQREKDSNFPEEEGIISDIQGMMNIYPQGDKISYVLNYIAREYVDPISQSELVEKTIPKLISELDPHSLYIPAKDLKEVNEPLEGNFSGIGVQFNMLNDTLIILKTIPNGPSEKIGILAGDRILIVEGDTVAGKNIPSDDIVKKLKGPKGTKVKVGIQRREVDDVLLFEITRDNIPLYSMDIAYMIRPGIGYIKLNNFSRTTAQEFTQGALKLIGEGMKNLILDLRSNGGGYMEPAVEIADQFLDGNQLIVYTVGNAQKRMDYRASNGGMCKDIQLVVLIDEGTASASEILAGALQDNDIGTIIGRRSFGKGLVQTQQDFSDGSALRLTIARYYTPTGRCIQKPYENGESEDYYLELSKRFLHGEATELDSVSFNDSLRYTTPGGKVVYGGGGIMPDVFVPIDTSGISEYLANVRNRGLIYRFALSYTDSHRDELEKLVSVTELRKYLDKQNVLQALVKFAAENDVPPVSGQIHESELILKTQLYAFIARNIYDNEGFYPMIEDIDTTLLKAIEFISNYLE
ncbi:MAG: PDZ domain-containing protein [Bacteroidales bacterium]|nr:PDZ domain-containing protein [Bacteroidales bacterium]